MHEGGLIMKITWLGHSAFRVVTDNGIRMIFDPYESDAFGGALTYGPITEQADLVFTSHEHADHNHTKDIKGPFTLVAGQGNRVERGIDIKGISVYHDTSLGSERGRNTIFSVITDDLVVVHLGDLGHPLDADTLRQLGRVDILFIPVGGFFTIDAQEATAVMKSIAPTLTLPMHYKTSKCGLPIAEIGPFLEGKTNVRSVNGSDLSVSRATLPVSPEIVVLQHAL